MKTRSGPSRYFGLSTNVEVYKELEVLHLVILVQVLNIEVYKKLVVHLVILVQILNIEVYKELVVVHLANLVQVLT